jgi:hypothetical protein
MLRKTFHPDRNGERPTPAEPTPFLPGTEAKLQVLRRRARERLSLWHPQDARCPAERARQHH